MPELLVGPALRYVSQTEATIWVETDEPCEVSVHGETAPTFAVAGHHYALVRLTGLEPGAVIPYEVRLDGGRRWPLPGDDFPVCAIRTLPGEGRLRVAFGSCRLSVPHRHPYTLTKDEDPRGREVDALYALTLRMRGQEPADWPHAMLWLGDQVYADEVSPRTKEFMSQRRDLRKPPGAEVADFEEYTRLYWESWRDPAIRWLLSTVSSSMIWDDHDVHDDWNTSASWLEEMRRHPWWNQRLTAAIMSYWIYQHIGNLSPRELEQDECFRAAEQGGDITEQLREFALQAERTTTGTKWSHCRDFGRTRMIVIDSRAGRVLDGTRQMVDEDEWRWIGERAQGDFDHLLLGTSLPFLLSPAMHHLEAWNEAVCAGAWGGPAARLGEKVRRGLDLEHWAAFDDSFDRLARLTRDVGAGEHGPAPASIVALSGDVHHAYLADVAYPRGAGVSSAVWQAVCSPVRNPLDHRERRAIRLGTTRGAEHVAHALARAAGVKDPEIRWRLSDGPWFDNVIATLDIDGRRLDLRIERACADDHDDPESRRLETMLERRLA